MQSNKQVSMSTSRIAIIALCLALASCALAGCMSTSQTSNSETNSSKTTAQTIPSYKQVNTAASDSEAAQMSAKINVSKTLEQYRTDASVHQFLFVRGNYDTTAHVQFYVKDTGVAGEPCWTIARECDAFIGEDGLGQTTEENSKTPVGIFSPRTAFGIKANPGTTMDYVNVTENIWACGDREYYNQIIDSKKTGHTCESGEHMIQYSPEYNYGIALDYNADNQFGKGSAIFMHCIGSTPYTGACIALPEEDMKYILQNSDMTLKICIKQF